MLDNIDFKYVSNDLEKKTKDFIIDEYIKHYDKRISKSQYDILYENMGQLLLDKKRNAFYIAQNKNEEIIGTISISYYDNRITNLKNRYHNKKIAEVGRCYVNESYRRQGIASKLLDLVQNFAKVKNYEKLYLHTHYFLPGGFSFWKHMGFTITLDENDSLQTVHMEKVIKESIHRNKLLDSTTAIEYN